MNSKIPEILGILDGYEKRVILVIIETEAMV
ncbi:hypothetical protein ICM_01110 [Bacillus cereus BAG1X2-3]|jgi:hypothetical protein|uniref:Uncharacterized protein n=2 Tax=Bacillus cereus group TaxID=86661 RepID=A0A9W5VTM4_BACCE|nr:hypothetical protein AS86_2108 [Bacillus thuringiensis HD1002]ALZ62411.1 hypothetical protein FORC13_3350 [Bacillus cereus]EJR05186.1 hypothetical protein II5_03176 [Bacillus cereus MSX-A1]EJR79288.1 hypothetical protein IK7_03769 [Bacillus cereus VD156]EOO07188.1 hypothetical protein IAW_03091 [Bacillus cereus str. Schrouff]EOO26849.1 hypothetical protein ICC_03708 [Bacillus cereus BAG1X1-1]EOO50266.1 hypothetical protein ICI_01673 [Bacillus cereus BAG1X2-1]EOO51193.1 hypothetical protei